MLFENENSHGRITTCQGSGSILPVSDLADEMRHQVRRYTRQQQQQDKVRLVGILAQDTPFCDDAELYSDCIARTCQEDGIEYELCRVMSGQTSTTVHLEEAIQHANQRDDVHGILVYYPIFKRRTTDADAIIIRGPYKNRLTGVYYKTYDDYLRDMVDPSKDVEGLCHEYNARWLFRARGMNRINQNTTTTTLANESDDILFPCTAFAVMKILEKYHHHQDHTLAATTTTSCTKPWSNCVVTIVNRSEILGRPLAAMLALQGATVYSVDADSILLFRPGGRMSRCSSERQIVTLESCLQQSSVVVSGVPSPHFSIPCHCIQPGTTVVNVSEFSNVNNVDTLLALNGVQYIPQVGKVTVAALELNLIQLHRRRCLNGKRVDKEIGSI